MSVTPDPELPAELRSRYESRGLLGQGAFGAVHRARDRELDRDVAIKVLLGTPSPDAAERFEREAEVLAGLRHPGIVEIYDFGVAGSTRYLVMELLRGRALAEDPPADPVAAVLEVAEALEVVHAAGIVHRDLKPSNLVRTPEGRVVLLDFGLARDGSRGTLTKTGAMVGTMAYLAPEVWRTGIAEAPSDWYALGVVLYQLAEGELPRRAGELQDGAASGEFPPVTYSKLRPGSPAHRITEALLANDPATRPADAATLRGLADPSPPDLDATVVLPAAPGSPGPPGGSPGRARAAVVAGAIACAGALGWMAARPASDGPPGPDLAAAEAEAWAPVAAALEHVVGAHRSPGGELLFTRRDGPPGHHLGEVLREVTDPRVASRRRRLFRALPGWLAVAPREVADRKFEEVLLPALEHLGSDALLLSWYQPDSYSFACPDPEVLRWEVIEPDRLDARIGELGASHAEAIRALAPWADRETVLRAQAAIASDIPQELDLELFDQVLARAQGTADLASRARLLEGMLLLGPTAVSGAEEYPCARRAALVEAIEETLADPGARAAVPGPSRAMLAGILVYRNHLHLQACRTRLEPGDLARIDRILRFVEESAAADPVPGAVGLEAVLIYHRRGGFLTTPFGEDFDARIDAIDALHQRLDTEIRGEPRGWNAGWAPRETRGQGLLEGMMR